MQDLKVDLQDFQKQIFDSSERFLGMFGGKQVGKTFFGSVWEINEARLKPKVPHLITAPTVPRLNQSTLAKFFSVIPSDWGQYKEQKKEFVCAWGTPIYIRGVEDPQAIEGMTIGSWWGDEAAEYQKAVWDKGRVRLNITRGRCLFTTSLDIPPNWLYYDFFLRFLNGDKDYRCWQLPSWINKYFDSTMIDSERARLTPEEFSRIYEGKFATLSGLVIKGFDRTTMVLKKRLQIICPYKIHIGVDFGWEDPSVAVFWAELANGWWVLLDEVYRTHIKYTTLGQLICDTIKEHPSEYLNHELNFYCDPSNAQGIAELRGEFRKQNLPAHKFIAANNDISEGIRTVNGVILEKKYFINPGIINHPSEIEKYQYRKDSVYGEKYEEPIDAFNHTIDPTRYCMHTVLAPRRIQQLRIKETSENEQIEDIRDYMEKQSIQQFFDQRVRENRGSTLRESMHD